MTIIYCLLFIIGCVYFLGAPFLFYQGKLTTSELISILAVVPLSLLAIFQEQLKRWFFAPKLKIVFSLGQPFCSKTPLNITHSEKSKVTKTITTEAFYFRIGVLNEGKSQAKLCEAFIAELQEFKSGQWQGIDYFQQVNLKWDCGKPDIPYIDINPSKIRRLVIIGHIFKQGPGLDIDETKQFHLDYAYLIGGYQPRYLDAALKYRFNLIIAAENAEAISHRFEFEWSGVWKDKPEEMFKEICIKLL
jgi:hypothetical protein